MAFSSNDMQITLDLTNAQLDDTQAAPGPASASSTDTQAEIAPASASSTNTHAELAPASASSTDTTAALASAACSSTDRAAASASAPCSSMDTHQAPTAPTASVIQMGPNALIPPEPLTQAALAELRRPTDFLSTQRHRLDSVHSVLSTYKRYTNVTNQSWLLNIIGNALSILWTTKLSKKKLELLALAMDIDRDVINFDNYFFHLQAFTRAWDDILFIVGVFNAVDEKSVFITSGLYKLAPLSRDAVISYGKGGIEALGTPTETTRKIIETKEDESLRITASQRIITLTDAVRRGDLDTIQRLLQVYINAERRISCFGIDVYDSYNIVQGMINYAVKRSPHFLDTLLSALDPFIRLLGGGTDRNFFRVNRKQRLLTHALLTAIEVGQISAGEVLIRHGANIDGVSYHGHTIRPLHQAIVCENIEFVELLLEHGVGVTVEESGMTPLERARVYAQRPAAQPALGHIIVRLEEVLALRTGTPSSAASQSSFPLIALLDAIDPQIKRIKVALTADPTKSIDIIIDEIARAQVRRENKAISQEPIEIQTQFYESAVNAIRAKLGHYYDQLITFQASLRRNAEQRAGALNTAEVSAPAMSINFEQFDVNKSAGVPQSSSSAPPLAETTVVATADPFRPPALKVPEGFDIEGFEKKYPDCCCPISRELMLDPVVINGGYTLDRATAEACFALSDNHPLLTGVLLQHKNMEPNYLARRDFKMQIDAFHKETQKAKANSEIAEASGNDLHINHSPIGSSVGPEASDGVITQAESLAAGATSTEIGLSADGIPMRTCAAGTSDQALGVSSHLSIITPVSLFSSRPVTSSSAAPTTLPEPTAASPSEEIEAMPDSPAVPATLPEPAAASSSEEIGAVPDFPAVPTAVPGTADSSLSEEIGAVPDFPAVPTSLLFPAMPTTVPGTAGDSLPSNVQEGLIALP